MRRALIISVFICLYMCFMSPVGAQVVAQGDVIWHYIVPGIEDEQKPAGGFASADECRIETDADSIEYSYTGTIQKLTKYPQSNYISFEAGSSFVINAIPVHNATSLIVSYSKTGSRTLYVTYSKDGEHYYDLPNNTTISGLSDGAQIILKFRAASGNTKDVVELNSISVTATQINPTYVRDVTAGSLGTVCLPAAVNDVSTSGATFYSILGKTKDNNGEPTSVVFGEVNCLEAGRPYLFMANGNQISLTMSGTGAPTASKDNGFKGTFWRYPFSSDSSYSDDVNDGYYIINSRNELQRASEKSGVDANRAFIVMGEVPDYDPLHAPSSRLLFVTEDGYDTSILAPIINTDSQTVGFNIGGQRASGNSRGLVIENGMIKFIR
ncbi:MAG: hypothetical protein KBT20_08510 [Bacteroidales bacterium]|nr:hypothetical protein [Candidatus Liminaster caballi]